MKDLEWHPHKALLASASKDGSTKLWDPRAPREAATLHHHKGPVNTVSRQGRHPRSIWALRPPRARPAPAPRPPRARPAPAPRPPRARPAPAA